MLQIRIVIVVILIFGLAEVRKVIADDDSEPASALSPVNDIDWSQLRVSVVDPDHKPVVGAIVQPWRLLAGGGGFPWLESWFGTAPRRKTDDQGIAIVEFPTDKSPEGCVHHVSLQVFHPDFCLQKIDINVADVNRLPPVVTMERGYRLRISGVSLRSDRPLPNCHVMLEDRESSDREFEVESDGWLRSFPIRGHRRWFRVIHAPPDGPPQFSKLTAWSPDDPKSQEMRVEVSPGLRIMGKLSDNVPRPIVQGRVSAWCGSKAHAKPDDPDDFMTPLWWVETVRISHDGTFEFPSLPAGYLAQFFATADDWVSAEASDESYEFCRKWFADNDQRDRHQRHGQFLRLAGDKSIITIEMEHACELRVKCVNPNGVPLPKVRVSCWATQYVVGFGSREFCFEHSSLDQLRGRHKRSDSWYLRSDFTSKTNDDGVAVIRHLPSGKPYVDSRNDQWGTNGGQACELESGQTTDLHLTLQRLPK